MVFQGELHAKLSEGRHFGNVMLRKRRPERERVKLSRRLVEGKPNDVVASVLVTRVSAFRSRIGSIVERIGTSRLAFASG